MAALTTSLLVGIGLAASAAGTAVQMEGAAKARDAQQQEIEAQQRVEAQRKQAMELDAQRKQLEVLRNQQRARALGLATATAQGAQLGSGLQGGYGQIAGQSNTNLLGISQNLDIGRNIFSANADVSQARIGLADAGAISAIGSGISNLGTTMFKASPYVNALSKGFGPGQPGPDLQGGIWPA